MDDGDDTEESAPRRSKSSSGRSPKPKSSKGGKGIKGLWANVQRRVKNETASISDGISIKVVLGLFGLSILLQVAGQMTGVNWLLSVGDVVDWCGTIALLLFLFQWGKRNLGSMPAFLSSVLGFIVLGMLVILFWQSAHIYADLGRKLASSNAVSVGNLGASYLGDNPLGRMAAAFLTVIASMLQSLNMNFWGLLFVLLFCVIQFAEVAPMIVRSSPLFMERLIKQFNRFKKLSPTGQESEAVSRLIDQHNDYFESFLTGLGYAQIAAYAIDALVCLYAVPLIKPGTTMMTFVPSDIAWLGIVRIAITLFLFAQTTWIYIQVRKAHAIFSDRIV